MSGRAHGKSSISYDSGQIALECPSGSLFSRLIIGYVLGPSSNSDRYTVDFLFQDENAQRGDGLPESIKFHLCFTDLRDVSYWITNVSHHAVRFLFTKNEFTMGYIDSNVKLLKDIQTIMDFFLEELPKICEEIEEVRITPLPPEDVGRNRPH